MRQHRRYLPWVLPSFLALVAPAAWIVSHAVPSSLNIAHGDLHDGIFEMRFQRYACNYGEIAIEYAHISNPDKPQLRQAFAEHYPPGPTIKREKWFYPRTGFLGFSVTWIPNPGRKIFSLFIPIWLFVLVGLIPLLRRLARIWVARERARTTCCPACGYDLRSSAERCPECGAAPGEVAIARDAAPAVIAVAKSSGTKCVALMAGYMTAAVFVCVMATPTRHFFLRGAWSADYFSYIYYVVGLAILLGGAFHAAGYSRSIEGFFGCGTLCSLLITPLYVYIGKWNSVWIQLAAVVIGAVLLGSLVCAAAILRWRWQDRGALRKSSGARGSPPSVERCAT